MHQSASQRAVLRRAADYKKSRGIFVGALLFVFGASTFAGLPLNSSGAAAGLLGLLLSLRENAHGHAAARVAIRLELADFGLFLLSCLLIGVG